MEDGNIENGPASRPEWEHLEEWLRGQMQGLIQELARAGGHRVSRQDQAGSPIGVGQRRRLPERLRTAATTDPEFRDHTGQEASGARHGGEIREPAAAPVRPQQGYARFRAVHRALTDLVSR